MIRNLFFILSSLVLAMSVGEQPASAAPKVVALSATQVASGHFTTDSVVTYTVVISNTGSADAPDRLGNEFSEVLPPVLGVIAASATSGVAALKFGTTVTWDGVVPAGGSVTITFKASIRPGYAGTTVSIQGVADYDSDLGGNLDSSVATDDPGIGGASDPTTFVVLPAPVETPTLSGLGLLALGLGLAFAAWSLLRRRRPADRLADLLASAQIQKG